MLFILSLLLLTLGVVSASAERPPDFEYPVFQVFIKKPDKHEFKPEGTAFLIDNRGYFLTASHLFRLEPGVKPFEGEIKLVLGGFHGEDAVQVKNVKEIFHQTCSSDPDISILQGELPNHVKIESSFNIAPPDDFAGRALVIYGYPKALTTWEIIQPLTVNQLPFFSLHLLQASSGGIKHGHSGSPLFDRPRGVAYGVTFGVIDYLKARYIELCTDGRNNPEAKQKKNVENCSNQLIYKNGSNIKSRFCSDDILGYIDEASKNRAILFTKLDGISEPFSSDNIIPHTDRLQKLLVELDSIERFDRRWNKKYADEPISTIEAGALLKYLRTKGQRHLKNDIRLMSILLVLKELGSDSILEAYGSILEKKNK